MMQQFHTQEYPTANRNYKDRLFRFVFSPRNIPFPSTSCSTMEPRRNRTEKF